MKEVIKLPKIRFAEFESSKEPYQQYLFKDIFNFSTGRNIKQKEASPDFETPCIRYGELYYMYHEVIDQIINRTNLDKSELLLSNGDEILLPSAGEDPLDIGSASALTMKNIAIGRTINILRPKKYKVYNQIYASYYINQKLRKKISRLAKGSSISNVYNSDLKKLTILLPKLPEQQKIATFLSAVDKKITQLEEKKTLLEQYKKGVMQKLFNQELRFKDDDGKEYPEWQEKRLGLVFGSEKGKGLPKSAVAKQGLYPCILYGELYTKYNEVITTVQSYTNNKDGLKSTSADLLIPSSTTTTGIDLANITALTLNNVLVGSDIIVLRSKTKTINNIFYAYYLSNHKKNQIASRAQGITIVHIYFNSIKDLIVDVPHIKEQIKIADFLSSIDKKIEIVSNQIQQTQLFKKGLLKQMFV